LADSSVWKKFWVFSSPYKKLSLWEKAWGSMCDCKTLFHLESCSKVSV